MERAGRAVYRMLRFRWPRARRVCIVCGPGNNGGDGYLLGRHLHEAGLTPVILYVGDIERQQGDAALARAQYQQTGCELQPFSGQLPVADVMVDALLGTGTDRQLQGGFAEVVAAINAQSVPVLAIDLPTGIDADSGRVLGVAVRATATLSLVGLKRGTVTGPAIDYVGEPCFDDLAISERARLEADSNTFLVTAGDCQSICPVRKKDTHKGEQGKILTIGGARGMTGALVMASEAALRSGAGLVRMALRDPRPHGIVHSAELMTGDVDDWRALISTARSSDVILLGPGLATDSAAHNITSKVLEHRKTGQAIVLDADALGCLAMESKEVAGAVLTPHPGEAARLLGCSSHDVQNDRYSAAETIARKYDCICVLKGAGTIISDGKTNHVCDRGHPAMATAGMGDVLSGMIAALLGQGLSPVDASRLSVLVHALAAERLARVKGLGLVASDVYMAISDEMTRVCRW